MIAEDGKSVDKVEDCGSVDAIASGEHAGGQYAFSVGILATV